jgi:hypothetical protein
MAGQLKDNFDYVFNGEKDDFPRVTPSTKLTLLKLDTLTASDFNQANKFSFHHNKGTLKFVNIQETLKSTFPTSSFLVPDTWTTKFNVKDETTLQLFRPISFVRISDDRVFIPDNLSNLPFSMSFENVVTTPATSSAYLSSYADVTIGNLRTFSGDVHKVKLFTRQQDKQNQEFEKIGEFVLQSKNSLVDSDSVTGEDPIGIFYSQSVIDNHWVSSSNFTTQSNAFIMNAALISGSNRGENDFVEFKTKDRFEMEKGEEYILSFSGHYIKGDKVQSDGSVRKAAEIEVLLSGSVVSTTEETLSIGSVSDSGDNASPLLEPALSGSIPYLYNYVYTHKKKGDKPKAGIVFRVKSGQFHISDIRFEAVSEQNFNPGFYKTRVPMPSTARRGQRYDFISEFYDFNNNKASVETSTSASVLFAGPKQVLADGTDAVLSGSVLVGESIEMYGVNPAYLRSVGYNGFDKTLAGTGDRDGGFMLFSGSVGTAIGASETYNGVGIEVVQKGANPHQNSFLQFASDYKGTGQSRFRVQTDEFILGRSGSGTAGDAYISGSNGNLEMSSSNFHLSAEGNVTMSGIIVAKTGGTIGGFTIGASTLEVGSGANFVAIDSSNKKFRIGAKSSFSNSNDGVHIGADGISLGTNTPFSVDQKGNLSAKSGSIGGFRMNETTLFSDSKEFVITGSTGQITGSKVLFTGGKIGGIVLSSTGIASADSNPAFQVTASTGQITGSLVKFDGGTIGGFSINSQEIKTSDFQPGVKGVLISSKGNGFLEVEEAKIRGTLSTTVFEKETVNAVGGQLLVAGSTTITGSAQVGTGDTVIQVANASAFANGDFIIAKKFNASGFTTEIMKVNANPDREDASSATNFSGSITVLRAQGTSDPGSNSPQGVPDETLVTGKAGVVGASAQTYEPGQVLVSTGQNNTGFIKLNANPSDDDTPYIDIVERNGTGVYDMDLKVRLGDLGGISDTINGQSVSGFGLYTDNAFLKGGIVATYGSIAKFNISGSDIFAGNSSLSNSGVKFVIGDAEGTPKIALGNASADSMTLTGGSDGFFVDGDGDFRVGDADGERISFDRSAQRLVISSSTFMIGSKANGKSFISASDAYGLEISSSNFHLSASGKITASAVKLSGDITAETGNIGGFTIGNTTLEVGSGTNFVAIDSNNKKFRIGAKASLTDSNTGVHIGTDGIALGASSVFKVTNAGALTTANITATGGEIGGLTLANNKLTKITSNVGIAISGSDAVINVFSGSHDTSAKLIGGTGAGGGALEVSQSGIPLIRVGGGEKQIFQSLHNMQMFSIPREEEEPIGGGDAAAQAVASETLGVDIVAVSDRPSFAEVQNIQDEVSSGVGIPTVRLATAVVEAHLSASKINAGQSFFLKNERPGSTKNTKFRVFINDSASSGSKKNIPAGFDIRKRFADDDAVFSSNDSIHQSMAFNALINSARDSGNKPKFISGSGGSDTGSAVFHYQTILAEENNDSFGDGKFAMMRLDVDTSDLYKLARRKEFVFLEMRQSTGSANDNTAAGPATKQRVFQVQASGSVVAAGNITAFGTTFMNVSDERLKENMYDVTGSLNRILELKPTHFTWKENKKQDVGFIAQEVEEIIPEVVETSQGFINTDGEEEGIKDMKTISYPKLIPYLVDTIQELTKRIEKLEEDK